MIEYCRRGGGGIGRLIGFRCCHLSEGFRGYRICSGKTLLLSIESLLLLASSVHLHLLLSPLSILWAYCRISIWLPSRCGVFSVCPRVSLIGNPSTNGRSFGLSSADYTSCWVSFIYSYNWQLSILNCQFIYAGMVELVDSGDLGSPARACRFESCCPHQQRNLFCLPRQERFLCSIEKIIVLWYNQFDK